MTIRATAALSCSPKRPARRGVRAHGGTGQLTLGGRDLGRPGHQPDGTGPTLRAAGGLRRRLVGARRVVARGYEGSGRRSGSRGG